MGRHMTTVFTHSSLASTLAVLCTEIGEHDADEAMAVVIGDDIPEELVFDWSAVEERMLMHLCRDEGVNHMHENYLFNQEPKTPPVNAARRR